MRKPRPPSRRLCPTAVPMLARSPTLCAKVNCHRCCSPAAIAGSLARQSDVRRAWCYFLGYRPPHAGVRVTSPCLLRCIWTTDRALPCHTTSCAVLVRGARVLRYTPPAATPFTAPLTSLGRSHEGRQPTPHHLGITFRCAPLSSAARCDVVPASSPCSSSHVDSQQGHVPHVPLFPDALCVGS